MQTLTGEPSWFKFMMHVHIFTCLFCVWISQIKVCLKGDQWSINNLITYPSSLFRELLYFWHFHQKVLRALQTNPINSLIIIHTLQALRGEFLKIPPLFSVFHTYTVFTYAFYPTHAHTHAHTETYKLPSPALSPSFFFHFSAAHSSAVRR